MEKQKKHFAPAYIPDAGEPKCPQIFLHQQPIKSPSQITGYYLATCRFYRYATGDKKDVNKFVG